MLYCPLKDNLFIWSNYKHLEVWKDSKNIWKILSTICYIKTFLVSIGLRMWPSTSFVNQSNTWPIFSANCIWLYDSKTCSLNWHWHSSIHWRATEHVLSAPIGKYSSKVTLVLLHGSFIYWHHQIFLCFLIYYKWKYRPSQTQSTSPLKKIKSIKKYSYHCITFSLILFFCS